MRNITRQQLASGGLKLWRNWLSDGLKSFTRYDAPEERVRAFLPVVIRPLSHYPAAELEEEIQNLLDGKVSIVAEAAARVLSSWNVQIDGSSGATIGIDLATRLDAPGLAAVCNRIVSQQAQLSEKEADRLVWVSIRAVASRGSRREILKLAQSVSTAQLWTPTLVAEYAVVLGKLNLRTLPGDLLKVIPALQAEPHTGEFLSQMASRLRLEFPRADLRAAFSRNLNDKEAIYRFRQSLCDQIGLSSLEHPGLITPEAVQGLISLAGRRQPPPGERAEGVDDRFEASARQRATSALGNRQ